jgi:hypothetical protein
MDARLRQPKQRLLQRLLLVRGHQHDGWPALARDDEPLVLVLDAVGVLGQVRLQIGQRRRFHVSTISGDRQPGDSRGLISVRTCSVFKHFSAGHAGARVTGGRDDSRPMEALAQVAELLAQNKLVIKVQTFPFDRAAEAYRISQGGHVWGKLVLIP